MRTSTVALVLLGVGLCGTIFRAWRLNELNTSWGASSAFDVGVSLRSSRTQRAELAAERAERAAEAATALAQSALATAAEALEAASRARADSAAALTRLFDHQSAAVVRGAGEPHDDGDDEDDDDGDDDDGDDDAPEQTTTTLLEGCHVEVPGEMVYWRGEGVLDADLMRSGRVPPAVTTPLQKYLTFVPDLGGWNNVRLALENAIVIARTTGRTLVLPPRQSYYLLNDCKKNCVFGMDTFVPFLKGDRFSVVSSEEFFEAHLPTVHAQGRLHTRARPRAEWPPPVNVTAAAAECTPMHVAANSCFTLYRWLDDHFRAPLVPKVYLQCLIFGNASATGRYGAEFVKKRVEEFCHEDIPWTYEGSKRTRREAVDGDAIFNTDDAILHLRSNGMSTHHAAGHAKSNEEKTDSKGNPIEPGHLGRLMAPWYTYVLHVDPAVANFHKRLIRDLVRYDERRVTCAAAAIVGWLQTTFGRYSSLHARRNEFQYTETVSSGSKGLLEAVGKVAQPEEVIYIATDEKNLTFFDGISDAGYTLVFLSDLLDADFEEAPYPLPPAADLALLSLVNSNELGFVDTLVAAHGRTFTGSWFSTFTAFIQRLRGYSGYADNTTYFSAPSKWAAAQRYEHTSETRSTSESGSRRGETSKPIDPQPRDRASESSPRKKTF